MRLDGEGWTWAERAESIMANDSSRFSAERFSEISCHLRKTQDQRVGTQIQSILTICARSRCSCTPHPAITLRKHLKYGTDPREHVEQVESKSNRSYFC